MADDIKKTSEEYTKGIVVGGIIGAVFSLVTGKKVMFWTIVGAVGGGFIAFKMRESKIKGESKNETKFKNYDVQQ